MDGRADHIESPNEQYGTKQTPSQLQPEMGPDELEPEGESAPNNTSRRRFLAALGSGAAIGLAGCFAPPPNPRAAGPVAGSVPDGGAPTLQEIHPDDTPHHAATVSELRNQAQYSDGRIVWLSGESYDLTGSDLDLRGITLASGRSEDRAGAVIHTDDQGFNSPVYGGGSDYGFIHMDDNTRITGVEIRGPHTNVTEHPAIPGYLPFAPGGSGSRRSWRRARFARGITIGGDNCKVDNCEIWGFGVHGIAVGPQGPVRNAEVAYCHIHNCMMTSYGYCIDVRHGDLRAYRCYFDASRHSICSSGMADANYYIVECTFGPWTSSHQIDAHRVGENGSGSSNPSDVNYRYRAGGTMLVSGCIIMPTRVPNLPFINHNRGNQTPHVTIRGVPADGLYFENNICGHQSVSSAITQRGVPGGHSKGPNGYVNLNVGEGNVFGESFKPMQHVP